MKLTVERDELSRALGIVSRAVAGKTSLPVLTYVLMDAEGDDLTLMGTDLVTGLHTSIRADIQTPGRMTFDPKILAEWLGSVPPGAVTIDVDPVRLRATLRSGGARITMAGISPDDYPEPPRSDPAAPMVTMAAATLRSVIGRTIVATSPDETRPVLHGIRCRFAPDYVELAAADGFRMAVDRVTIETGMDDVVDVIVPRECASILASIVDDDAGQVEMRIVNNAAMVGRLGAVTWTSRLIDGQFPDVTQLIRRSHAATISVGRQSLRSAIRGSRSLSKANNDVVFLSRGDDTESLRVDAFSADRGDAERVIPISLDAERGEAIPERIALDWRFVDAALGVMEGDTVALGVGDSSARPVQLSDPSLPGHVAVLMPIAIGG